VIGCDRRIGTTSVLATACVLAAACAQDAGDAGGEGADQGAGAAAGAGPAAEAAASLVTTVDGFSGPESVRYDPDQDVYFVGNFNGRGGDRDDNGFISRLSPDGTVENLRFIDGASEAVTLHAPRGMTIVGDTLWVCDVDAVRGFDRRTGEEVGAVDFSAEDVGFLNDIAADADGTLYVTDTGRNRIYRIADRTPELALEDDALGSPNGITYDDAAGRFIVVPYGGANQIFAWRPGNDALETIGQSDGARFDGVERSDGRIIVASQADSALHLFADGAGRAIANTAGAPADIALDTRRRRVAVPFIALNQVEIWQLPDM
jgi:glucose/arabinose dehydrogenase